jgi:hypothetical protein
MKTARFQVHGCIFERQPLFLVQTLLGTRWIQFLKAGFFPNDGTDFLTFNYDFCLSSLQYPTIFLHNIAVQKTQN